MFIRFDRIHERDGRTDRRQTPQDGIGRAYVAKLETWFNEEGILINTSDELIGPRKHSRLPPLLEINAEKWTGL